MDNCYDKLILQILKNQMALLACGQIKNMHDIEEKSKFYDLAFKGFSDTRFVIDEFERKKKKQ